MAEVAPRRSRCMACQVTHVLLPVVALLRRADLAEVIGWALAAKAAGSGARSIAARLGRPGGTGRGGLRRVAGRAGTGRGRVTPPVGGGGPGRGRGGVRRRCRRGGRGWRGGGGSVAGARRGVGVVGRVGGQRRQVVSHELAMILANTSGLLWSLVCSGTFGGSVPSRPEGGARDDVDASAGAAGPNGTGQGDRPVPVHADHGSRG